MKKLVFISGLPRSGSTLLAALLQQNPRFYANMSGPLSGLLDAMVAEMSAGEFSEFIDDETRKAILCGVVENYYANTAGEVIFDTGRAWCARLPLLRRLLPGAKVIACVRHMPWIIDSFERLSRHNALRAARAYGYDAGTTAYSRVDSVVGGNGSVGYAFNALKEAYFGGAAPGQLMLLQYETLVQEPSKAMDAIYRFINEESFEHAYQNVEFDTVGYDEKAGQPGLHTVHPVVALRPRETVLPPDLYARFENDSFWRHPSQRREGIQVI
ncbi:sulfotransferase [Pseudomonas sp. TH03]|uniref:sulfotransferase n=1 Tax=Pseudomonas sp. TH03 TaxID=2796369 RepID=UPI001F5B5786|nr:sulfotransferase [Pseudomonas sp. TH03]